MIEWGCWRSWVILFCYGTDINNCDQQGRLWLILGLNPSPFFVSTPLLCNFKVPPTKIENIYLLLDLRLDSETCVGQRDVYRCYIRGAWNAQWFLSNCALAFIMRWASLGKLLLPPPGFNNEHTWNCPSWP